MRKIQEQLRETSSSVSAWRHNKLCRKIMRTSIRKLKYLVLIVSVFFISSVIVFSLESSRDHVPEVINDWDIGVVTDIRQLKYRLWPDDPQCRNHVVQFIRNCDRPPMALASYPGSGNTFVRGIIERLTGYFTGSVYSDIPLYISGFYGEIMPSDSGCTVVQKTHHLPSEAALGEESPYDPVDRIVIIRNPYKAILSFRNFVETGEFQLGHGSSDAFTGSDWDQFVSTEIDSWRFRIINWITKNGNFTRRERVNIVHYENLIHDRENQLRKLVQYIQLPINEERLACAIKHDFDSFKRNSSRTIKKDPFTSQQRMIIDQAISTVQTVLELLNFDPLPLHHYNKT